MNVNVVAIENKSYLSRRTLCRSRRLMLYLPCYPAVPPKSIQVGRKKRHPAKPWLVQIKTMPLFSKSTLFSEMRNVHSLWYNSTVNVVELTTGNNEGCNSVETKHHFFLQAQIQRGAPDEKFAFSRSRKILSFSRVRWTFKMLTLEVSMFKLHSTHLILERSSCPLVFLLAEKSQFEHLFYTFPGNAERRIRDLVPVTERSNFKGMAILACSTQSVGITGVGAP
jgi:hypothetical protein